MSAVPLPTVASYLPALNALIPAAVVAITLATAIGVNVGPTMRSYRYTAWIVVAVVVGLCYPQLLLPLNPDDASRPLNKWIMLVNIQLVMFGISTQMRLCDFASLGRSGVGVLVGLLLQFSIMPLTGYGLARAMALPPEIAAGVVLIGSCSSGLASNVMTYIAGGNLPLSITLTAVGTLLAPILTPLWMKILAGQMVEVNPWRMMLQIIEIMLVPLGAALLHDWLRTASTPARRAILIAATLSAAYLGMLVAASTGIAPMKPGLTGTPAMRLTAFVAAAMLVGVGYHAIVAHLPRIANAMPVVSMFGIVYYTAITTAAGRNELLATGMLLFAAVVAHNAVGYALGYALSRAAGLDRQAARTVALEVGLQNGGMATGIATGMSKLATLGLAAAVFSPWMNVTGSLLANYWRRRPIDVAAENAASTPAV